MKRIICAVICIVLIVSLLASCGDENPVTPTTTAVPTTVTTTTTTTTVSTTPAPRLYDFFDKKDAGGSVRLTGDVMVVFILVDDNASVWKEKDIKDFKAQQEKALKNLKSQASRYGAELNVRTTYIQSKTNESFTRSDYSWWISRSLSQTNFPNDYRAIEEAKSVYGVDEVAFVFATNQSGRSFAVTKTEDIFNRFEFVILYKNDADRALNHELLHLFGAQDFYYPEEFSTAAEKHFGQSTMLNSYDDVDDLTAYLVGWTDRLSDKAQAFLDDTAHITEDYVYNVHQEEVTTGVGTKHYASSVYTGDLVDGMPHGKGVMKWDGGDVYEGEWAYGEFNGKGKYTLAGGGYYDGEWKDGYMHGYGTKVWANGDKYVGYWSKGNMQGQGTITYADGRKYSGYFENNVLYI